MANIAAELAAIMAAVYGEEVRGSIHDAIDKINTASEKAMSSGSAFAPGDSATGYPSGSLYLNTSTNKLLRSNGTSWEDAGSIKGNGIVKIEKTATVGLTDAYTITYDNGETDTFSITNGNGIVSIVKTATAGLIDTYTITYDNELTKTFDIKNGENGNKWYTGVAVSGKSTTPGVFPGTGITKAWVNDFYLNVTEGAVYHCTLEGAANVAKWVYDFTMAGGGGASAWGDLTGKPFTTVDDGLTVTSISGHPSDDGILKVKLNTGTHKFDDNDAITLADAVTNKIQNLDANGKLSVTKVLDTDGTSALSTRLAILDGTDKEADLFLSTDGDDGLKWVKAPNGTKRYFIGTIPANMNMLGEWQYGPESSWRKKDDDDHDTFVFDAAFYEDASKNEVIDLTFKFDAKTQQPIYLAGFQWWNDETAKKGGVNCLLGNVPDTAVDVWVEVMRTIED